MKTELFLSALCNVSLDGVGVRQDGPCRESACGCKVFTAANTSCHHLFGGSHDMLMTGSKHSGVGICLARVAKI